MSKLFWVIFSVVAVGAGSLGFCWGNGLFSKETQDPEAPSSPIPEGATDEPNRYEKSNSFNE